MCEYLPPFESDSEASSPPESEATVCGAESWFSQVTVEPASMLMVEGLNENDWMSTVFGVDANVVTAACVVVGCEVVTAAWVVVGAEVVVAFPSVVGGDVDGTWGCVVSSTFGSVVVVSVGLLTQPEENTKAAIKTKSTFFIIIPYNLIYTSIKINIQ